MAEHLDQADKLCAPRQMRFPEHFNNDVESLISMIITKIVDKFIMVGNKILKRNIHYYHFLYLMHTCLVSGFSRFYSTFDQFSVLSSPIDLSSLYSIFSHPSPYLSSCCKLETILMHNQNSGF